MELRHIRIVVLLFCFHCFSLHADIKIGTPVFEPPFVVNFKGNLVEGYDIDLMNLVCAKLHWKCIYVAIPYDKLFSALEDNKVDFIIGNIIITPERSIKYLFSLPYLPGKGGFLTLKTSSIKALKDLKEQRVGTLRGKIYSEYLSSDKFLIPVKIKTYTVYTDLILALKNNSVAAVFINYYTALYLAHQHPEMVRVIEGRFDLGFGIGIAGLYNKSEQIKQINKVLLNFQNDGTFVKLYGYYFLFFSKKFKSQGQ